MKQSTYSFKQRLSGGLLCCLILLLAYVFQAFFPELYVDAFSSSIYLVMWLALFVGAVLWTFRTEGESIGIAKIVDWQFVASFVLITANEIYVLLPKEIQLGMAPVLSEYTIPVLVVIGVMVACVIKASLALQRKLADERQRAMLQAQKIQQLIDNPPTEQEGVSFLRMLIENRSIAQLSAKDYLLLVEGCRLIDPELFAWLGRQGCQPTPRDIVLCVLIRMRKTKEEIVAIFCISIGAYRTMKSRARQRLGIEESDLEDFLQNGLK